MYSRLQAGCTCQLIQKVPGTFSTLARDATSFLGARHSCPSPLFLCITTRPRCRRAAQERKKCNSTAPVAPPAGPTARFIRRGTFRFPALPPEIRNLIYQYAMISEVSLAAKRRKTSHQLPGSRVFPLMRISKAIYQETLGLYYANTPKPLDIWADAGRHMPNTEAWLQDLSSTAIKHLRRLRFLFANRNNKGVVNYLSPVQVYLVEDKASPSTCWYLHRRYLGDSRATEVSPAMRSPWLFSGLMASW